MKLAFTVALVTAFLLPPQQRFTSATTLLTVDATVTDRDGRPVPGLTADDFAVKINGKLQPVRAVTFLSASAGGAMDVLKPSAGATPTKVLTAPATPEPRVFVLLLDDLSIRAGNSKGPLVSAERFVNKLPPQDIVGFTTTSGLVTVNPTLDREALLTRLRHAWGLMFDTREVLGPPTVGFVEALQIDDGMQMVLLDVIARECGLDTAGRRLDQLISINPCAQAADQHARNTARLARRNTADQLMAMEGVMRAMGKADGIKQLVVVSGGVAVTHNVVDFIPVAKAAAAAGVQLTMMVEAPDIGDGKAFYKDNRALSQAAQTLTDMSGGQFYSVIGQAERFYDRVLLASSAIYRLGVELPGDIAAGADVTVQVSVAKRGLTVSASHHSVAPLPPPPPLSADEQMKNAIASGTPSYGVPLQLDPEVVRTPGTDQLAIRVVVTVPASVAGPLSGVFAIVDDTGALKSGKRSLERLVGADTFRLEFLVPVTPGKYKLRFAVADANGAVGAVEVKVTAG